LDRAALAMNLRTLLILGRVSNLPTVWSNLLAGWTLNWGDFRPAPLALLLTGGSLLYVGGMYLNDFCDAEFDARFCPQRPIPSGQISRRTVGSMAVLWFMTGFACLFTLGPQTAAVALLLIVAIVIYDFHHKGVPWAPLAMGTCRLLLYPLAAFATGPNVFGSFIFGVMAAAIAMGLYVAGITYLARGESRPQKPTRWALILLVLPIAFAFGVHAALTDPLRPISAMSCVLFSALFLYWMAWMLVPFWRKTNLSLGRVVSGLLAGIVLVDMLLLTNMVGPLGIVLAPLFGLALLLQRVIPAT
jgi:4-hydroxybenzoate polyprenyltransferase